MITTINISLPKKMYEDAKKELVRRGYASISELIRDVLRRDLYPKVTENGFTPEFERQVLEAAKEPRDKSRVWKSEKDIEDYFENLRKELGIKRKNGKN